MKSTMEKNDNRALFNIAKTLNKKSSRDETGLFLIEGHREIDLALNHGVEIIHIFDKTNTSAGNLERISYRGETIAVAKAKPRDIGELTLGRAPLIVVLDALEKPGNIGAVIRTCDAAGADAVLICGGAGDQTNPNLIRASLGAVFTLPCFCMDSSDALLWLNKHEIPVIAATPDAQAHYFEHDYSDAAAIIVGSEAAGVSQIWLDNAAHCVSIPMTGQVNSLNVSVSAAIVIYEAVKCRLRKRE